MEKVIVVDKKKGWVDIRNTEEIFEQVSIPFDRHRDITDIQSSLGGGVGTRRVVINKKTAALVWNVKEIREIWDNGEGFKVGR